MDDNGVFSSCDFTSYCNFCLALVFFTVGTIVTVWARNEVRSMLSYLGHMWLVGPFLISLGLIFTVKTVLYLRKKNLMAVINRQQELLMEVQETLLNNQQQEISRNLGVVTSPPTYDSVAGRGDRIILSSKMHTSPSLTEEPAPPTYEEALEHHIRRN